MVKLEEVGEIVQLSFFLVFKMPANFPSSRVSPKFMLSVSTDDLVNLFFRERKEARLRIKRDDKC